MTRHAPSIFLTATVVSLASLSASSCSSASETPTTPNVAETSAPEMTSASAAPDVPSSSGATPAPTQAGAERRFLNLKSIGPQAGDVPVSIEVPAEWGTEREKDTSAKFRSCEMHDPVFGTLDVFASACDDEASACLDRMLKLHGDGAEITRSGTSGWAINKNDVKGHHQITATRIVFAKKGQAVVCSMILSGDANIPHFGAYKSACDSLTVLPAPSGSEAVAQKPKRAANPASSGVEQGASDVAIAFYKAAAHRDVAAASKLLMAPSDCNPDLPSSGGAKSADSKARCKKDASETQTQLPKLLESVPKDFEPSFVARNTEMKGADGLYILDVFDQKDPCGDGHGLFVVKGKDRWMVVFAHASSKRN